MGEVDLVDLGFDPDRNVSSKPLFKSGPKRGYRRPETGGRWVYISGYVYDNCRRCGESSNPHLEWAGKLMEMGFLIGEHHYDGVVSFYIFVAMS